MRAIVYSKFEADHVFFIKKFYNKKSLFVKEITFTIKNSSKVIQKNLKYPIN